MKRGGKCFCVHYTTFYASARPFEQPGIFELAVSTRIGRRKERYESAVWEKARKRGGADGAAVFFLSLAFSGTEYKIYIGLCSASYRNLNWLEKHQGGSISFLNYYLR